MRIYIGHSNEFDFKKELYEPIKRSSLYREHQVVFPHEDSKKVFNSKEYLKNCDLMIAEVSYPSMGLGIEIGWADMYKCKIVCVYKRGSKISGSLSQVCDNILEYSNTKELVDIIERSV